MKRLKTILLITIAVVVAYAAPASATPIYGQVTDGAGGTVIPTGADGWVDFYIPLDGSRQFDGTLPQDSCHTSTGCDGGTLNLFMQFGAGWTGATQLTIEFDDFDHPGYGDNGYFTELLQIIITDSDGDVFVFDLADIAALISGDSNAQQLVLNIDISGAFDAQFIFTTGFADYVSGGFYNTLEGMRATAEGVPPGPPVSVPEPGTLALLGAGLLFLAVSRRRKKL